jgi:hypothetical protein
MKGYKSLNQFMQSLKSQLLKPRPSSLLYNRVLLYAVFAIALFQLYTFSVSGNVTYVAIFLLIGFLTSFFSKNMTVVLVIALAFTGLLYYGISPKTFEGMVEGNNGDKTAKDEDKPKTDGENTEEDSEEAKKKKQIANDVKQLEQTQEVIVEKFKEIEPYMSQAEGLVGKIEKTTETLKNAGIVQSE